MPDEQVHIPFAGGLDQKTAEQYLDPNQRQVAITNGNFVKVGAIDKRLGIAHLPTPILASGQSLPLPTTGTRLMSWTRSDLSLAAPGALYNYVPSAGALAPVGKLPICRPLRRALPTTPGILPPSLCDFAVGNALWRAVVYVDALGDVVAMVIDADTGDVILEPLEIFANHGLQVSIISVCYQPTGAPGAQVCAFLLDYATNILWQVFYNPGTNRWSTPSNVASLLGTSKTADAVPFIGDPRGGFLVVYVFNDNTIICLYLITNPGAAFASVFGSQSKLTVGKLQYPVRVWGTFGENVYVGYSSVTGFLGVTDSFYWQLTGDATLASQGQVNFHSGLPSTFNAQWYISSLVRVDAGHFFINVITHTPGDSQKPTETYSGLWYTFDTSLTGNPTGQGYMPLGYVPAAKTFIVDGSAYQPCYFNPLVTGGTRPIEPHSEQITLYLMQYSGLNTDHFLGGNDFISSLPVATVAPRQVFNSGQRAVLIGNFGTLPLASVASNSGTRFAVGLKTIPTNVAAGAETSPQGDSTGGPQPQSWAVDLRFDSASVAQLYQPAELGQELHLSGGVPVVCDAQTTFEDNFFQYPEFSAPYLSPVVGTGTLSGTFTYGICYAYTDSAGLLHRGAPVILPPITVGPTTGQAGINIFPCSATWRDIANPGQVYAEIYRTVESGTTFYLVDRVPVSGRASYVVWGADETPDTDIQVASILYTAGGVLDNVNPPSATFQCTHRNRLALVDETLQNVWFSKQFVAGEAPGFNEILIVSFPEQGDITAIRSLDDKFVCFKAHSIWVMYGDGPSQTGSGSDWTVPQAIASDVGCIAWQSVVLTPVGLMFQAENGINLLDRSLQVTFIGKNVLDTLAAFPTITSAALVPASTQVRFTCSNGASSITIVYDYLLQQWTTHSYAQLSAPIASAALTHNTPQQYSLLTTDGNLWQEKLPTAAAAYFDTDSSGAAHFVPTTVKAPWIKMQLQNYQQARWVQFLGQQLDDCGLTLQLASNYDGAVVQTGTWTSQQLRELPIPGQVQMYVDRRYNMQMALQVTISDSQGSNSSSGAGMRFVGVVFDINNLAGRYPQVPPLGRR